MMRAVSRLFPYTPRDGSVVVLLVAMMLIRLAISAFFPVIVDEAYAVTISRVPALSYFDHPALAFGLARCMVWLTGSEAAFVVRFPYVIMGTLSGWYLFRITKLLYGERAGQIAVAWYSIAPFFFISAGHFVVPDGPLNLFLILTFWLLLPVFTDDAPMPYTHWCLAGLTMAFALMSKYQSALFGLSILIIMLSDPKLRKILSTPRPWLALSIAACGLLPTILWNAQNDWISFKFQTARAVGEFSFYWVNFFTMQLGQLLYLTPGIWLAMLWLTAKSLARPINIAEKALAIVAAVPVVVFGFIALSSESSLPHWPLSGFLFAFPFIGCHFATFSEKKTEHYRNIFLVGVIAVPCLATVIALQTYTAFLTRPFFTSTPRIDADWQIVSWSALTEEFTARGIIQDQNSYIVPASWIEGGRAGYALGPGIPVARPLKDPRHFAYLNDIRLIGRKKGYVVYQARIGKAGAAAFALTSKIVRRFTLTGERWTVIQTRAGFPAFEIGVIGVAAR